MASYISKLTDTGQLTIPKKIRQALGLEGPDYVKVALVGRIAVIRRLQEEDGFLKEISEKVKQAGLTRARMRELLDRVKKEAWEQRDRRPGRRAEQG